MTARLHDAGFLHIDFHPGNILVRFAADDEPELVMIDLDALRKSRRLTWKAARQNLALLDHFFWLRSSRTDRYRFLKTYLRESVASRLPRHAAFAQADRGLDPGLGRAALAALGTAVPVDEQVLSRSSRKDTCWCVASRDLDPAQVQPLLDDPDAALRSARTPGSSRTRGRRRWPRRRWWWRAQPTPVDLQAVQPQEMARSRCSPCSGPRAPGGRGRPASTSPAAASRRRGTWRSWRARRCSGANPSSGSCPHETYLITVKEENVVTWRSTSARSSAALGDPARGRWRGSAAQHGPGPADPVAPRAVALASGPEGLEHPDPSRSARHRTISSASSTWSASGCSTPSRGGAGSRTWRG